MKVCVTLTPEGTAGGGFGRAPRVGVATVEDGVVTAWAEHPVRWDELHDVGTEGGHHARIARFLREESVDVVAAGHMGPPMVNTLGKMGIGVHLGIDGDPQVVVLEAAGSR